MSNLPANKNTELKVVKEKSIHSEAQDLLFAEVLEAILPKVKPLMKPAVKRFTEFMSKGNIIQIQFVEGRVYVFVIKEENLTSFEMKEGTEPDFTYDVEDFLQKILSGEFK